MFTSENSQQIEKASYSRPVISAPRAHFTLEAIADILCYQEAQHLIEKLVNRFNCFQFFDKNKNLQH
jgi:hypothetical protein